VLKKRNSKEYHSIINKIRALRSHSVYTPAILGKYNKDLKTFSNKDIRKKSKKSKKDLNNIKIKLIYK